MPLQWLARSLPAFAAAAGGTIPCTLEPKMWNMLDEAHTADPCMSSLYNLLVVEVECVGPVCALALPGVIGFTPLSGDHLKIQ